MTELETVLAVPYHYRRKGIYYVRLREHGATADSFSVSLRTSEHPVAKAITRDIMRRLATFHFGNPAATWQQLKARLKSVSDECLAEAHGDVSVLAYGASRIVHKPPSEIPAFKTEGRAFYFTPRGVVEEGCAIHAPDYGSPEKGFGNPRGEYRANLTIPCREAVRLINVIVATHEANYAALKKQFEKDRPALVAKLQKGKKLLEPYEGDLPFFENDDGTVTFKIKGYASYIDSKTQESKPLVLKVVDAKGKRIENVPAISGGSELKVKFSMFPLRLVERGRCFGQVAD